MSTPMPMCTRLREHVEAGMALLDAATRDGVIDAFEQAGLRAHQAETLSLSEEHESTTRLAIALQHGGYTKRTYYGGRELDAVYGTGELSAQLKAG